MATQEVVTALASSSWSNVSQPMAEYIYQLFSGLGSTKPVEDAFRVLRGQEQLGQYHKQVACVRRWGSLVDSGLLAAWGRKPFQSKELPLGPRPPKLPRSIFEAHASEDPKHMRFQDITGRQKWVSCDARGQLGLIGETQLLSYLHTSGDWSLGEISWHSSLLHFSEVYEDIQSGQVFISLGTIGTGSSVLSWPLEIHSFEGTMLLTFSKQPGPTQQNLSFRTLTQWGDMQAVPTRVLSPASVNQMSPGLLKFCTGITLLQVCLSCSMTLSTQAFIECHRSHTHYTPN